MADPFDDDEQNPPIGFEQDPDEDELGIGTWRYADGSTRYSKGDAEDAKALMSKAPAGSDRLAEAGARLAGGDFTSPKTPATRADAGSAAAGLAGEGKSPEEEFLSSTTGAEAEDQALGGAAPEPAAQPAPATRADLDGAGVSLANPALPRAGGPARYTDTAGSSASQSESANASSSVSRTGSAQSRPEFEQQQRDVAGSYDRANQGIEQGNQGLVDAIQKRRAAMAQMGADREAATAAAMAQRDARANQVKQKIGEVSSRKTDHNKIWKDKGVAGTTLGLLGVALRSLTATKFGGPNTALQAIQEQRKQNLQAQMEDRDSELRGLERELGSLDAAVPMLEARMRDAENKRIEAMLLDEKSAQVIANGKQLMAQNNIDRDKFIMESAKAYAGTLATQQSQGFQQSATEGQELSRSRMSGAGVGGGAGTPTTQDMVKELLARRDMKSLTDTELTHDEFQKELGDYREKAAKQNEFRSALDALTKELGTAVTRNQDGSVSVSGEPDVDLLPSEKKRRIDAAFARLKRADVMSMTREPSADLQDEFGGLTDRPFWDSEIVPKLQRFYDMHGQLQSDLDGGYSPSVVRSYRSKNDVSNKPSARPVKGSVPLQ